MESVDVEILFRVWPVRRLSGRQAAPSQHHIVRCAADPVNPIHYRVPWNDPRAVRWFRPRLLHPD